MLYINGSKLSIDSVIGERKAVAGKPPERSSNLIALYVEFECRLDGMKKRRTTESASRSE